MNPLFFFYIELVGGIFVHGQPHTVFPKENPWFPVYVFPRIVIYTHLHTNIYIYIYRYTQHTLSHLIRLY